MSRCIESRVPAGKCPTIFAFSVAIISTAIAIVDIEHRTTVEYKLDNEKSRKGKSGENKYRDMIKKVELGKMIARHISFDSFVLILLYIDRIGIIALISIIN